MKSRPKYASYFILIAGLALSSCRQCPIMNKLCNMKRGSCGQNLR